MTDMREVFLHFDGSAWNRQCAGWGFYAREGGKILTEDYGRVPCLPENATNNAAEHYAASQALAWAIENRLNGAGFRTILVGDSKLVISQLFRGWRCNDRSLPYVPYLEANQDLVWQFDTIRGKLIPRYMNTWADHLSKQGIQSAIHL